MPLPDPVDHHPGGQRVLGRGDPAGQLQPAAPRGDRRLVGRRRRSPGTGGGRPGRAAGSRPGPGSGRRGTPRRRSSGTPPSSATRASGTGGGAAALSRSTSARSRASSARAGSGRAGLVGRVGAERAALGDQGAASGVGLDARARASTARRRTGRSGPTRPRPGWPGSGRAGPAGSISTSSQTPAWPWRSAWGLALRRSGRRSAARSQDGGLGADRLDLEGDGRRVEAVLAPGADGQLDRVAGPDLDPGQGLAAEVAFEPPLSIVARGDLAAGPARADGDRPGDAVAAVGVGVGEPALDPDRRRRSGSASGSRPGSSGRGGG